MDKGLPVMIQGTHSDAGKSIVVTALCRIFSNRGYKTAPFKSQNMSLNSYITVDGKEIGRAQGVQAEAAGIVATTDMNPILIKPTRENESQIVVHGKPYQNMKAGDYRDQFYQDGLALIKKSFQQLQRQFERIIIEGAGSPAEINLNDREMVNMSVAKLANAPVILVGDIDKGGVFASLVGTLQLIDKLDRDRVIGVIINKFRGDISLLEPGLKWFQDYTGIPILGVLPFIPNMNIEAEDSVVLDNYSTMRDHNKEIDIAVIHYPRISNFTDIDPFMYEPDCHVRFVKNKSQLGEPDLIILPGSKNTLEDLSYMKDQGLESEIVTLANENKSKVFGICGGYQMLGDVLEDKEQIESVVKKIDGMGLIQGLETNLTNEKTTVLSEGIIQYGGEEIDVTGYEIHMGRSTYKGTRPQELIRLKHGIDGSINQDESIIGTYFHGVFDNDRFREVLLNDIRSKKKLFLFGERQPFARVKQEAFENLANVFEKNIQIDVIEEKMLQYKNAKC